MEFLITGANGWLGKRLVRALTVGLPELSSLNMDGQRVRCLVPTEEPVDSLLEMGAAVVSGDIRDQDALNVFTRNAEGAIVIHLAGIIHPKRVSEFEDINVQGTLALLQAVDKAKVKRLVVMSSNSPIGCNPDPEHRFTENSPYNPYMGYGHSKWQMELALQRHIKASKTPEISIIRSPWFYGPGQPARQTQFFSMIKNGKFPIVGHGNNKRSMGYVDSLVLGLLLAASKEQAANEIFWIADESPYSMNDIIATVRTTLRDDFGMNVRDKCPKVPSIVGDVARTVDKMLQSVGMYHQKIHVLSEMNQTIACDISKAKQMLGFKPLVELREGMRRSIEWCLANNIAIE